MTTKTPEVNPKTPEIDDQDDLVWANEVLRVYRHLGKVAGRRALGSSSAKNLHEWASNPENAGKFLSVMVPKATDLLAKLRNDAAPDHVEVAEHRSVDELRLFLKREIEKSQKVTYAHES